MAALNDTLRKLVDAYGPGGVIAGLALIAHEDKDEVLFRKLNRIYEWHLEREEAKRT